MVIKHLADIEASKMEYLALPDVEWRKDYFDETTGGFVATHKLKDKDDITVPGIKAEADACISLAKLGKHVLRLPENVFDQDGHKEPRGYPDAYFDGQTWDFKTSSFKNEDTIRHRIRDGRKADNVIFITRKEGDQKVVEKAVYREAGMRKKDGSWKELPNVYTFNEKRLFAIWKK